MCWVVSLVVSEIDEGEDATDIAIKTKTMLKKIILMKNHKTIGENETRYQLFLQPEKVRPWNRKNSHQQTLTHAVWSLMRKIEAITSEVAIIIVLCRREDHNMARPVKKSIDFVSFVGDHNGDEILRG